MLDGGGLFWRSARLPSGQAEGTWIKAQLVAESYALTGIDAVGLAPADLVLGWPQIKSLATDHELPFLSANLSCDGAPAFPATKLIERGGVKLGVVGAYVGAMPREVSECDASEPVQAVQAAVAELGDVDVLFVLGAWDAREAAKLTAAVPAVDFVISATNLTLPDGRPLGQDDWLLGTGSRGKKLGVFEGTLVDGGAGWQGASPGSALADRLDSYRQRLVTNRLRLEDADDDKARARAQRQVDFYVREIERMEAELAAATAPRETVANRFENRLESLSSKVADHEATAAKVAACNTELEEKGLDKPVKPIKPDLPPGIPAADRIRAGLNGMGAPVIPGGAPPSGDAKAKEGSASTPRVMPRPTPMPPVTPPEEDGEG